MIEIKEFVGHKPKEAHDEQSDKKIQSTADKAAKKDKKDGKKKK